jgi:hypothetical protein
MMIARWLRKTCRGTMLAMKPIDKMLHVLISSAIVNENKGA